MPYETASRPYQAPQAETFAARQTVRLAMAMSQEKEHAFFTAAADAVGRNMKALCSAWSTLLTTHALGDSLAMLHRFATATAIDANRLVAWRDAHRSLVAAEAELASAHRELAAAEETRSQFAGRLWGAKKGYEQEYAHRDGIVGKAKANIQHERAMVSRAETILDRLSEALLRDCIGQSATLSTSAEFGAEVANILRNMQAEATSMQQRHDAEQAALMESAAEAFISVAEHYRKS